MTRCTLRSPYRDFHLSHEEGSVLLAIHPKPATYRHHFIAGQRSPLFSNFGSCKLTYLRLVAEQRLRSSHGDMWQLYVSQAEKHDPQLAEHWKGQTDTILNIVRTESFLGDGQLFHPITPGRPIFYRRFHIFNQGHRNPQTKFDRFATRPNIGTARPVGERGVLACYGYPLHWPQRPGRRRECVVGAQLDLQPHLCAQRDFGPTLDPGILLLFPIPHRPFDSRKNQGLSF